jgi:hypothetical protein
MAWVSSTPIDKTDNKFGVVATIPLDFITVLIWQDTTNPSPIPLDMDALRLEIADLGEGFYSFAEHHIFAEVIDNG